MHFNFEHDDPRLGRRTPGGAILQWPAQDVNGKPYNRLEVTTHGVLGDYFVVLPPGTDSPDHDYTVNPAPNTLTPDSDKFVPGKYKRG